MGLDETGKPYYITLKLEPLEGEFWREQYEDVIPGYYMNKLHWNSIKPDGAVPDDILRDMLDKSYRLVLSGFSKKKQREILGKSERCLRTSAGDLNCVFKPLESEIGGIDPRSGYRAAALSSPNVPACRYTLYAL